MKTLTPKQWFPPIFLAPSLVPKCTSRRGIKSISQPRANRYNRGPSLPVLSASVEAALKRKAYTTPLRTGVLGIKKGMTGLYEKESGRRIPCTVVQMDQVQVVSYKTRSKNGYYAVQVGMGSKHPRNVTRPLLGHFSGHQVSPKRYMAEFKVLDERGLLKTGEVIGADWFQEGQYIDARASCRGMGFAGVMKKHGMHGQPASHGVSLAHRSMGSAGQSQGGGSRVYPGKKMAGRMGGQQVTVQNVKILQVDTQNGLLVLNGCLPGPKGCVVKMSDAIKKPWPETPPELSSSASSSLNA